MKRRASAVIGAAAAAVVLSIVCQGCNTVTSDSEPCYPGDYTYCACANGVQGYSQCTADAGAYGACDCSGGTSPGEVDAAPPACDIDAGPLAFGCTCHADSDCKPGPITPATCHDFSAKGGYRCTYDCMPENASMACLPPSGGCNMMGQCMVP